MRMVVIGSHGLIGAQVAALLRDKGHEVIAPSTGSGASAFLADALPQALSGADVLIDVADPPSFETRAVREFFGALSRDLAMAAAASRVDHHVCLSMVGIDRADGSGYFRAKLAQESLIRASSTPYTILRSTQSLEFIDRSLRLGANSGAVLRLPIVLVQPIAADDLAQAVATIATAPARNRTIELAGPEPIFLHELARLILGGHEDPRRVVANPKARYFGALLSERSLMPGPDGLIGSTTLREWLRQLIMAG